MSQYSTHRPLLCGLMALMALPAAGAETDQRIAEQFLADVLAGNPGVESNRLEWEAMAQTPEVVASLPDPVISYGSYFTPVQTRTGAIRQRVGISQKFPFPGKLGTAKARSVEEAHVSYWRFRAALRDVFAEGRILLSELYRADGALVVLREQEALLRQTAQSAKALVETSLSSLANVLRADVAAEDLAVRIAQVEAERTGVAARMAALRGETGPAPAVARYVEPKLPVLPSLNALMARSMVANQDLEAARAAVARDELGIRAAALEYFPDVTLGFDYSLVDASTVLPMTPQNGNDPIMGTLAINVPIWWDKLGAQKQAALARHGSSQVRQAQLTADVSASVQAAYAMAHSMQEQRERFRARILPAAEQAWQSTLSAYSTGTASLTDLLDVQRAYLGTQLGLIDRTSGYLRAVANLERAIGEPLERAADAAKSAQPSKK